MKNNLEKKTRLNQTPEGVEQAEEWNLTTALGGAGFNLKFKFKI